MSSASIIGLDIGSGAVKAVYGEVKKDGKFFLSGAVKRKSAGLRKGAIVDFDDAVSLVRKVLSEIKEAARISPKNIFVSVGDCRVKTQSSRGIVAVSRADNEIYNDDIERVNQAAAAVNLPSNRTILHNITREYIVDGTAGIRDPLGMSGTRLEVDSLLVEAFSPAIKNLTSCLGLAGGELGGIIFSPLAAGRAVLAKNQKELGVVLIDIGFGTTGFAVYEDGRIIQTAVFPSGAGNITNDLAIGLRVPISLAEIIKLSYGHATGDVSSKEKVDLSKIDPDVKGEISRRFISEIIEARLVEILEFVNNELKLVSKAGKLPAGAVIAGGGAKMPGLVELVKSELRLPAQIGIPDPSFFAAANSKIKEAVEDPEYAVASGLVLWGAEQKEERWSFKPDIGSRLSRIFKNFLP